MPESWEKEVRSIIARAEALGYRKFYALISGGKDSVAAAHITHRTKGLEGVIFIDTTIGIRETQDFVKSLCRKQGWPLIVLKPEMSYEQMVLKYGFPGPAGHKFAFIYLKWKPLYKWFRQQEEPIAFISGARKYESKRRLKTVQPITQDPSCKKMLFVSPLFKWKTEAVWNYFKKNHLEVSPVYKTLHLSGDCLCGAFARQGEAELISLFYPEIAQKIKQIERKCKKKRNTWGNYSSMKGALGQQRLEQFFCADCHTRYGWHDQ